MSGSSDFAKFWFAASVTVETYLSPLAKKRGGKKNPLKKRLTFYFHFCNRTELVS